MRRNISRKVLLSRGLRAGLTILAMVAVLTLLPASGAAQSDADAAANRELTRYLLVAAAGGGGEARSVDLLPARLPPDLPLAPSVPPGVRLIGSTSLYTRMRTLAWDVIYDAPATAAEIGDFYADALPRIGWNPPPSEDRPARGFYPAVMGVAQRGIFCGNGASLLVSTGPTTAGTLFVRLRVDAAGSLCSTSLAAMATAGGPSAANILPGLTPPAGVLLRLTSGSFTADRAATAATAATPLPAAALEAHYAGQLAAAGWTRTDGAATGPLAWSTWAVPGPGDFRGFLSALEVSDEDRRDLVVQISAPSVRVSGAASGGNPPPAPTVRPTPLPPIP